MDAQDLREIQAPFKARYVGEPEAAGHHLARARGR